MNQELPQIPNQSLHSTNETLKQKRPYNKISQEIRSQIIHALTVENLPLQIVADRFQTKACTCKAILLTYENEGRTQKKTNRRERVEISSAIRFVIQDPMGRNNQEFYNLKLSKIYSEEKQLNRQEEGILQKKLKQELQFQLGELQSGCYIVEQNVHSTNNNDEKAPGNIVRGINMSIHLISQKIKENEIKVLNKFSRKQQKLQNVGQKELLKIEEGKSSVIQEKFQQEEQEINPELIENFQKIKSYIENVTSKIQQNPQLLVQLNYLTNETVLQTSIQQRIQQREYSVQNLKQSILQHLKQQFNSY